VPYSLFSDNGVPNGQNPGDMLYWDGTQWIKVSAGQNGQVLTFNDGVPVWGGVQLPIINTNAITNINAFTAYGGGNIASDGGSPVIARGLCWNNVPNPTTANSKTINGSGAGSFNANLNALAASTLYYVRAYSTNSAGTSYGNEVSFTTANGSASLSTTSVTAITANSATSGGNITNNGGAAITMRGVCWNTSPFPTIANSKTTNGPGNGIFVSELTGLAPNTPYYVRAYATNSLGTSYGNQLSFTTLSGIVTLTTAEVTEITATAALSGGEITSDGGSPVTARGVCWSTSPNPTIADSTTSNGNGNGVFVSNLSGLLPDTLYYVRSYATNGVGTFYGNEVSFSSLHGDGYPCPGSPTVSYAGQTYTTVLIGTQCWMAQNLNVGNMINSGFDQSNNGTIEKYCPADMESYCEIFGGLYQWNEMMQYTTQEGNQGICPEGWHLPSDHEFTILANYLGGEANAGGKMKSIGTLEEGTGLWRSPNTGATNSSGFTALPSGYRFSNNSFSGLWEHNRFWSSTQNNLTSAWTHSTSYNEEQLYKHYWDKSNGNSLRCLKGSFNQPPNAPASPLPENGSIDQPIDITLSWTCSDPENDPLIYDVFFGTDNPPSQVSIAQLGATYNPGLLNMNTGYFWKVVAHDNHDNYKESPVWTIITIPDPNWQCGNSLVDTRDIKTYTTVQIGTQCWMKENLNVGTMINGTQSMADNNVIEKYCYDNSVANCDTYGGLYTWNEMMEYTTIEGGQGICPIGWYVPTNSDFCFLAQFLDPSVNCNNLGITGSTAGGKMKTIGTINTGTGYWNEPNTGATNESLFSGLPSGRSHPSGSFYEIGSHTSFWTSSLGRYLWGLDYEDEQVYHQYMDNSSASGISVRCIKD